MSGFKIVISSGSGFCWLPLKAVLGAPYSFLSEGMILSKNLINNANMGARSGLC